jgi:putative RNA 2'-phosphotransferase
MNAKDKVRLSKFLSLVLRHDPGAIGIELDANGWTSVDELITKAAAKDQRFDMEELRAIVSESDKQRFAMSADGTRIRANQGHSIEVQLGYEPNEPPTELFHGTAAHNLELILAQGLIKGARHHVHLSADKETALKVGQRHGKPAILRVDSGSMHRSGIVFYRSENGVWLTDHVPPVFLQMEAQ